MAPRGLYVFSHRTAFGNAPAHTLTSRINAELIDGSKTPRSFSAYKVTIDHGGLPEGVNLDTLLG
jgi:CRISPR-associated protein Csd2